MSPGCLAVFYVEQVAVKSPRQFVKDQKPRANQREAFENPSDCLAHI